MSQTSQKSSFIQYTVGFVLSVLLTLAAYVAAVNKFLTGWDLVIFLIILAIAQLIVQLLLFLHMGDERRPRWNLMAFLFMALMVLVIGIGSIWIMHNLNYRMMPQHEVQEYMEKQDSF
jgi:cytochrome o ubiquinol oxidase operon protein cyoD